MMMVHLLYIYILDLAKKVGTNDDSVYTYIVQSFGGNLSASCCWPRERERENTANDFLYGDYLGYELKRTITFGPKTTRASISVGNQRSGPSVYTLCSLLLLSSCRSLYFHPALSFSPSKTNRAVAATRSIDPAEAETNDEGGRPSSILSLSHLI